MLYFQEIFKIHYYHPKYKEQGRKKTFFFFLRACYLPMCWVFSLMFLIHKAILRDKFYYYLILWMRKMKPPKRTNDLSWAPQIASGKVRAHTQSFLALKHYTIFYRILQIKLWEGHCLPSLFNRGKQTKHETKEKWGCYR